MENYSFETDYNAFRCVECNFLIKVEFAEKNPRSVGCEKCGTSFLVSKREGDGLTVEVLTDSEPDVISEEEKNLEENDE